MSNFDLPIISASAKPEFTNVQGCTDWLRSLPLINVGPSHGRLLGELEELNCSEIQAVERLRILELLIEPVLFVQGEHAKKFSNRSAPLAKPEREILLNVIALWGALGHGYQRCVQSLTGVSPGLLAGSSQLALAFQRALWCASQELLEHYKCYLDITPNAWKLLHKIYAFAEEKNVTRDPVDHPVHKAAVPVSCMDTYVQALLLNVANPNEQTPRQLGVASRWLDRWADRVRILKQPQPQREGAPPMRPLAFDLAGASGASRVDPAQHSASMRFLDTEDLSNTLRKRVVLLRKGDTPASLDLGDDVAAQLAESLLLLLHRQWCEDVQPRAVARKNSTVNAEVATGMGALHYYITGLPFHQPSNTQVLTQTQREEIATFGRVATRDDDEYSKMHSLVLESWRIVDESLAGLKLERLTGPGRFVHGQLLAARPANARNYMLASVRWLAVDANYVVKIGVRIHPGVPRGVAIRATGLNAMKDKYIPALLLSAVPALKAPESLVLPVGWFKPQRVIDVFSDQSRQLRLLAVLDRGTDFERVSFEPA
jgi:hypothetical protein